MQRGKYIVLEGPEGVGKTTQLQELVRRLEAAGLPVRTMREPDSQSDLTARVIRQLTQDPRYPMNTRTEVLLYNAARAQSLEVIRSSIEQGIICVVDRNYLTTLAIQYYGRGDVPDYTTINNIISFAVGANEPDLCIVLDAPVPILKTRMTDRGQGERFDNLDEEFLERVRAGYLWEAQQRHLPVVFATEAQNVVADQIWQLVSETLSKRPRAAATESSPTLVKDILSQREAPKHEPPLGVSDEASKQDQHQEKIEAVTEPTNKVLLKKKKDGSYMITADGTAYLDEIVTDTKSDVYAFKPSMSSTTVAAAMARLSRRGDDMRITLLDEFANKADKDEKLLQRVITAYGDDSVQQLVGLHVVVENASNLLTKKLEWGRLAAYLEQSTRYIYFDQKDPQGKYRYFTPPQLTDEVRGYYDAAMDKIFDRYSSMVRKLTEHVRQKSTVAEAERDIAWQGATRAQACDAIRAVLPVATKSTVGIYASGQALESLIMHLQSDQLQEARDTGAELLTQARKVIPTFLERADKPERGGALIAYRAQTQQHVAELAQQLLPSSHSDSIDADVTLVDYWPKNELSLISAMLYEHADMSQAAIDEAVMKWSYQDKLNVFNAYMGERLNRRHRPGRALERVHYTWDLLCDYGIFRDLQRHRMVDDLTWQPLTPRHGYEIPLLVEEAGLTDDFEACFDTSLELYSKLQAEGYELEAQYATLLGHRMRWKVTYNAREAFHLHELRTSPQGHPGYRKLVQQMHNKVADVHPLLAEAMKFVNQGEDEALTRLAAERYTQYKLKNLQ